MGFGKFGARPKAMSNPLYWVGRYRQDVRAQLAADRFNEKWHRLCDTHDELNNLLINPLNGRELSKQIALKLIDCTNDAFELREAIKMNINTCKRSELSKYATALKKIALIGSKACTELQIHDDIEKATYDATSKSIFLNKKLVFFIG